MNADALMFQIGAENICSYCKACNLKDPGNLQVHLGPALIFLQRVLFANYRLKYVLGLTRSYFRYSKATSPLYHHLGNKAKYEKGIF
jgi:hypothetical protein